MHVGVVVGELLIATVLVWETWHAYLPLYREKGIYYSCKLESKSYKIFSIGKLVVSTANLLMLIQIYDLCKDKNTTLGYFRIQ